MPKECCKTFFASIPDDEPVFTIAARDLTGADTVRDWIARCEKLGVNSDKLERSRQHLADIERFQSEHPERCKIPD